MSDGVATPTAVVVHPSGHVSAMFIADPAGLWTGLRRAFLAVRPHATDPLLGEYAQITHADVVRIVEIWEQAFHDNYRSDADGSGVDVYWDQYLEALTLAMKGADPDATFSGGRDLWLHTRGLATRLSTMHRAPSRFTIVVGELKDGIETAAGIALRVALGGAALGTATVAHKAAHLLDGVATGAWRSIRTPLLVGVALIGAILVLPRVWPGRSERQS